MKRDMQGIMQYYKSIYKYLLQILYTILHYNRSLTVTCVFLSKKKI